MTEQDSETFERFARRLAGIETVVKDPSPLETAAIETSAGLRPGVRWISRATAIVAVVFVAAAVITFIAPRPSSPPMTSPQVGLGGSIAPSPPSLSPEPTGDRLPPLDPVSPPEEPSGPCSNQTTVDDRMRTTIEQDASRSSAVVIGTVTGVGGPRWNTPDGRLPVGAEPLPSQVVHLLRVDVETVVKGPAPAIITVWIPGGLIGCHGFFVAGFGDAEVGSRYALFLDGSAVSSVGGAIRAWQMWSIDDGLVQTSFESRVTLASFQARVSTAP